MADEDPNSPLATSDASAVHPTTRTAPIELASKATKSRPEPEMLHVISTRFLIWLVLITNILVLITAVVLGISFWTRTPVESNSVVTNVASPSKIKEETLQQEFSFAISHYRSDRQWGKCLNLIMNIRYHPKLAQKTRFLDYRILRALVLSYLQPSDEYPMPMQWEVVNRAMVRDIMQRQGDKVVAMASVIQVLSQSDRGKVKEPSNHGSIVSVGDMPTPAVEWVSAFQYDCTLSNRSSLGAS